MLLVTKESHSQETLKLRWKGEQLIPKESPPILYRGAVMSVEEVEAFFLRIDGDHWTGRVRVRGPVKLAHPRDGRIWSLKSYAQHVWNVEDHPWLVALLKEEIPDFEIPKDDDDE